MHSRSSVHPQAIAVRVLLMLLLAFPLLVPPQPAYAATTTYEAEASGNTLTGGASVGACAPCSNGQRVGNLGSTAAVQFNGITSGSAGSAQVTIAYQNGDSSARTASLSVNNSAALSLSFPPTGGSWPQPGVGLVSVSVSLNAGSNTIKLFNPGGYAPDFDQIVVIDGNSSTYTYGNTQIVDSSGAVTITNGAIKIGYNKATGLADFSWSNAKKVSGAYSRLYLGSDINSKDYTAHSFSTSNVSQISDGFGSGVKVTIVNTANGQPTINQIYYLYDNKPYFFIEAQAVNPTAISSTYFAPIIVDTPGGVDIGSYSDNRALFVPFDNDFFVRYNASSLNGSGTSSEASAFYDNTSRNGLVVGSVTHDTWKSAVYWSGSSNKLNQLNVFGGYTSSSVTHDSIGHGAVSGTTVTSPRMFMGYYSDWRTGMEDFGQANSTIAARLNWAGGVPFGWNSWNAHRENITPALYKSTSDFFKNNLQNTNFSNGAIFMNWDAGWSNFSATELTDAATYAKNNGQKPGIYFGPFSYFGNTLTDRVPGTNNQYTWGDIILRDYNNNPLPTIDGAHPLDLTHPGTRQYVEASINDFKTWGYQYIKLDFINQGAVEGKHYNPSMTGIQAYNYGMTYIKNAINGSMFISLSIAPLFPGHQYAHSRRISCDTFGAISDISYMLNSVSYGWWLSGNVYAYNDPDHMVTDGNTYNEAKSRVISAAIAGTVYLDSDNVATSTSGQNRTRDTLTRAAINDVARLGKPFRPVEGNTGSNASDLFALNNAGTWYLAVFNYNGGAGTTRAVDLARVGLNSGTSYTVTDLWDGTISTATGTLNVNLGAAEAKLFKLSTGATPTTYEAEASGNTLTGIASVTACAACSNGQRVGNLSSTSAVQFNSVTVGSAGSHTVTIYYQNGDSGARSASLSANNGAATGLSFPATGGGWPQPTVGTISVNVNLNAGSNTIKLFNPNGYAPDFDRIVVQ